MSSQDNLPKDTLKLSDTITFRKWGQKHKEAQQCIAEKAAREVTIDTAGNEKLIIETLDSIDFTHSKLSEEVLCRKGNPNQPFGDLELAQRLLIALISKNPRKAQEDIRKIDARILTLVYCFKEAIELGDEKAAYYARSGLFRAVREIRMTPQNSPEQRRVFVEIGSTYLDAWIALVGICQIYDHLKKNKAVVDEELKSARDEEKAKSEQLVEKLKKEPEALIALDDIAKCCLPNNYEDWTFVQREVLKGVRGRRLLEDEIALIERVAKQFEAEILAMSNQIELQYARIACCPIVTDPDLMNRYKEMVDDLLNGVLECTALWMMSLSQQPSEDVDLDKSGIADFPMYELIKELYAEEIDVLEEMESIMDQL